MYTKIAKLYYTENCIYKTKYVKEKSLFLKC